MNQNSLCERLCEWFVGKSILRIARNCYCAAGEVINDVT